MKCPNCQTENRIEAPSCKGCGLPLQKELKCPQWGYSSLLGAQICETCRVLLTQSPAAAQTSKNSTSTEIPLSFTNGRYTVKKELGDGGKKKAILAHNTVLDRDVAFTLLTTENLDEGVRTRINQEAQAMSRLGDNPHIVNVKD